VLLGYVKEGGRVVAFLGPNVDADAWNESLLDPRQGLLPCRLEGVASTSVGAAARLTEIDFTQPVLAPFAGWETLFAAPRFRGFYTVSPLGQSRVLARFDDESGSPALLGVDVGRGQVFLFASSADDAWTDWPRSDSGRVSYVSLMQWLVEHGDSAGAAMHNVTGGDALAYPLDPSRFLPEATLRPPADAAGATALPLAVSRDADISVPDSFVSDPLVHAGVWELELRGLEGEPSSVYFAVNPPEQERVLTRAEPDALRTASTGPRMLSVVPYNGGAAQELLHGSVRHWPGLVAAILALLFLEAILARLFSAQPIIRRGGRRGGRA